MAERVVDVLEAIEIEKQDRELAVAIASVLAQRIAERDIQQAELMALPFALLLTLLFFRSVVAALIPIGIGAFALAFSTALTRGVAQFTEVSIFSLSISAFLGLGLSIE